MFHDKSEVRQDRRESDREDSVRTAEGQKLSEPAGMIGEFGDYELLEEIGRGGQGVVFRAWQKSLNRTVAVKIIGVGQWVTDTHLKRFRREAEAAAKLNHPGIVPIYEVGERNGTYYFSMRFVEGDPLDEVVSRGPISLRQAAELLAKVARTVHYAHEHGILHRDIKPGNILLDADSEPHLTDFGLARLVEYGSTVTGSLEVMGTPSYMAPEQAVGNNAGVSRATDVYGLGAVLYELLTGHPPFAGGTTYETIHLLLDSEPRQPRLWNRNIDRDLSAICLKCLEKGPRYRYSSALALAEDLEHWLRHEPICAKRSGFVTHTRKWIHRNPTIAALIMLSVLLAAGLGLMTWKQSAQRIPAGIAVLPFENLSDDKEDAFFAEGVQDDILTKLAKIADLKVISRTSVMGYRGKRDLRQIGRALGVSHVVEGTARRYGGRVHVNAQLVDTRTDTGIWADEYERDLSNAFAIPSEIAQKVAEQLDTKISTAEKLAIERKPTADLTAFELYAQATNLLLTSFSSAAKAKLLAAADLLDRAIAHDPSFFEAYCQLVHTHGLLYFLGLDHTPARLTLAEAAAQAAFRLRPDAGEAHLALAENLYHGHLDYDGALAELEIARRTLPNDPRVFTVTGYILRRQGRWEESTRNLERAIDLDPRNFFLLQQIALSYGILRRYAEEISVLDRALTIEPADVDTKVARAAVQFHWKADTGPLHQAIDSIRTTNPSALPSVANDWLSCALAEDDITEARRALDAFGEIPMTDYAVHLNRPLMEGIIARMSSDDAKGRAAFTAARAEQEKIVQAQPDYGPALCVLGLIDAGLGKKEEALREGRRAVELLPVEKDAINGPLMIGYLAMIAAWVDDKELACEQLAIVTARPSPVSYGQLKLLPFWDPLRGDPRFEKIVVSLAPKGLVDR
ncbi:MAG TPA: protein kinase [Terriglobales bacterium]|jgi:serine/threonine protein kinase/tetratricopeptide (TPR) repeat protein